MSTEQDILYVADMAKKLGRTEAAIRMGNLRGVDWLPKPMEGMGRKVCWHRADVDAFMAQRRASADGAKGMR